MERKEKGSGLDFRFLPRALAVWLITSCLLLFIAAAIITVFDLKASCFPAFGYTIGFIAAIASGYTAKGRSSVPALKLSAITAAAMIILLLTLGFVISQERLSASGILGVVIVTAIGSLFGAVLRNRFVKNYKMKTRFFRK